MKMQVRSRWLLLLAALSLSTLSMAGALALARYQGWLHLPTPHPMLDKVRARGYLKCGVDGTLPSFSLQQPAPPTNSLSTADQAAGLYENASGFDADFCRVVAIAVFGDLNGRIAFLNVDINHRFSDLTDGTIDLLVRDTTWTGGRDVRFGVDFGPVIFHDGQKFMVHDNPELLEEQMTLDESVAYLKGKRICVLKNSTALVNLREVFAERKSAFREITTALDGKPFATNRDVASSYSLNECDAMTADESQLLGRLASLPNPQSHKLIPAQAISYAPLAPVMAEGDPHWRDLVSYAVWTTIRAEELGVSRANMGRYTTPDAAPELQRFLGITSDAGSSIIGQALDIAPDFTRRIIEQQGNYLEIWARNLGGVIKVRGPNQPWLHNPQGRLWSPPFEP
jgi:general L-amino acid transport system substrate-binding protein